MARAVGSGYVFSDGSVGIPNSSSTYKGNNRHNAAFDNVYTNTDGSGYKTQAQRDAASASSSGGSSAGAGVLASVVADQMQSTQTPYTDIINDLFRYSEENSAFNAAEAEKARDWSHNENQLAMAHSSAEAQKNRDWQEKMSDTAHQREVKDLIAAGLNPVLAAGGSGASTPAGSAGTGYSGGVSSASADNSASAIGGLFSSLISSAKDMIMQDKTLAFNYASLMQSKELAQMGYDTQLQVSQNNLLGAEKSAAATMAAAGTSAAAQRYYADSSAAAQRYAADQTYKWQTENNKRSTANTVPGMINQFGNALFKYPGENTFWTNLGGAINSLGGTIKKSFTPSASASGSYNLPR